MTETTENGKKLFWWSVAGWSVIHIVLAATVQVSGDEAYYWDCARHLDWAYYDQPGLMIWPIAFFRLILGDVALAVRAPALIASFVIALMMLGLVRRLGGGYGRAAGAYALIHLMPLFFLGSFYESTDIGLAAAFVGATWAAVAVAQGDRRAWWGFGLAMGLGFLAKFSIVMAFPIILVALAAEKPREDLRTPTPWLAAGMSLVLTAPVWIWAFLHEGDNIFFQGMRRTEGQDLTLKYLGEFLGAGFGLATPFLAVAIVVALWHFADRRRIDRWVVLTAAVMPFLFFGLISLKNRVGAHWGGPGMLIGAVVVALVAFKGRRWLIGAGAVFGLVVSLAITGIALAPEILMDAEWSYAGRPKRVNTGELSRLIGNEEMGAEIQRRLGADEVLLLTSYSDTHLFNFLSKGRLGARLASLARGKHGLASLYWYEPGDLIGRDALVVTPKGRLARLLPTFCTEVEELEPVEHRREDEVIRQLLLFRCRGITRDQGAFAR
ncbi:MAG: glycosyltransferase family 39 protein [Acidobacteriota bacterium]